jgi:hypothetical protein
VLGNACGRAVPPTRALQVLRGAVTPVYLACSPHVEDVTGRYFANRKPKTAAKTACDTTADTTAAAARLWQVSADLAEVRYGLL